VTSRADGSEGTGKSEEDDLLVGPLLRSVVVDGDTASSDFTLVLRPGNVTEWNSTLDLTVWTYFGGRGNSRERADEQISLTRRQRQRGSCHRS
jgi:hypothetical protein